MKLEDIRDYIVANNAAYVAALSTVGVPLVTLVADDFVLREYVTPSRKVQVLIDADEETVEEVAPTFRIVTLPVTITAFVFSGAVEAVAREQARNYAQAIVNTLRNYSDFFLLTGREDYEGVEGKPDIKATQVRLEMKYEEAT